MGRIRVVGVGPGSAGYLTGAAREAVAAADILVGGRRHLDSLAAPDQEVFPLTGDLTGAVALSGARWPRAGRWPCWLPATRVFLAFWLPCGTNFPRPTCW